ncbi:MAG: SRPBCC domain-containing protein, partial [Actinomycetia bacterium]|nr:SRPBCC domain-containing protein [Actinomycetes bacterium]
MTAPETTILADPNVPLVRITREFDAAPANVFRAHTEPELIVQWLGPRDLVMTVDHYDCRTGGSYRYVHSRGDDTFGFFGCFHDVRPSELIVQTFCFEGFPDSVALERLALE